MILINVRKPWCTHSMCLLNPSFGSADQPSVVRYRAAGTWCLHWTPVLSTHTWVLRISKARCLHIFPFLLKDWNRLHECSSWCLEWGSSPSVRELLLAVAGHQGSSLHSWSRGGDLELTWDWCDASLLVFDPCTSGQLPPASKTCGGSSLSLENQIVPL